MENQSLQHLPLICCFMFIPIASFDQIMKDDPKKAPS